MIGDLNGTNNALLNSMSLTGLNMVTVIDESLHPIPGTLIILYCFSVDLFLKYFSPDGIFCLSDIGGQEIVAIPDIVAIDSLQVVGNHSIFNMTWKPVRNVNIGQIFYELKISHGEKKDIVVSTFMNATKF